MTDDAVPRDINSGLYLTDQPVEMAFEIRTATGVEAQRLRLAQARVLREVIAWVTAQTPSEHGRDRAA